MLGDVIASKNILEHFECQHPQHLILRKTASKRRPASFSSIHTIEEMPLRKASKKKALKTSSNGDEEGRSSSGENEAVKEVELPVKKDVRQTRKTKSEALSKIKNRRVLKKNIITATDPTYYLFVFRSF